MGFVEDIADQLNKAWVKAFVLVVCILMVVHWLLMIMMKLTKKEHYLGDGTVQTNTPFTSGATMRVLSQLPTATNQADREWISNSEIKELIPGVVSSGGKERLVSVRADPNFFEIGDELAAYQSDSSAGLRRDAASDPSGAGSEHYSSSPASQVETIALAQMLGTYPRTAAAY